jgi:hypothetical protein
MHPADEQGFPADMTNRMIVRDSVHRIVFCPLFVKVQVNVLRTFAPRGHTLVCNVRRRG